MSRDLSRIERHTISTRAQRAALRQAIDQTPKPKQTAKAMPPAVMSNEPKQEETSDADQS